jgi:heptosyltransferase-2
LVTNDTGTMHLADYVGTPLVAIFGSTEPDLTGPRGPRSTVIRHKVECSPCFLRECPIDFRCMLELPMERVVDAVLKLLK